MPAEEKKLQGIQVALRHRDFMRIFGELERCDMHPHMVDNGKSSVQTLSLTVWTDDGSETTHQITLNDNGTWTATTGVMP